MHTKMKFSWTTILLWAVYIGLLAVLLPHTAWLFSKFEPGTASGNPGVVAWAAAFTFESAIAVLTHKLARRLEKVPKSVKVKKLWGFGYAEFGYKYLNAYSFGLGVAVIVSSLANLAHSVEYGQSLQIFSQWGVEPWIYQITFGAVLPMVSLVFAKVLSNETEIESDADPALDAAKAEANALRKQLKESETARARAEIQAKEAESRFSAAGDIMAKIFAEDKRQRILAAKELWPKLPAKSVAEIAGTSVSYTWEVLNSLEVAGETVDADLSDVK